MTEWAEWRVDDDGLDPLTGKPWVLCGSVVMRTSGGCVCARCARQVVLDEDGRWVYA
jgi:hypothetical protein